jgi:hypothetical protein
MTERPSGMGAHESPTANTTTWLTPPHILAALGSFDFDPCAAPEPRPWPTATRMNSEADGDGLAIAWQGRVWCNPPYTAANVGKWLGRLADHGCGTALIFARTETASFQQQVFGRASAILFLAGRLCFLTASGEKAAGNAGAPSVLCAYGEADAQRLKDSGIKGTFIDLVNGGTWQ